MVLRMLSGPSSVLFRSKGGTIRSAAAKPSLRTASESKAGDWNSRGFCSEVEGPGAGDTSISRRTFRTMRGGARKKHTSWP